MSTVPGLWVLAIHFQGALKMQDWKMQDLKIRD